MMEWGDRDEWWDDEPPHSFSVRCPKCGAIVGDRCTRPTLMRLILGRFRVFVHAKRLDEIDRREVELEWHRQRDLTPIKSWRVTDPDGDVHLLKPWGASDPEEM